MNSDEGCESACAPPFQTECAAELATRLESETSEWKACVCVSDLVVMIDGHLRGR